MKCAICGIQIDSVDEAIDNGWIHSVYGAHYPKCQNQLPNTRCAYRQVRFSGPAL